MYTLFTLVWLTLVIVGASNGREISCVFEGDGTGNVTGRIVLTQEGMKTRSV